MKYLIVIDIRYGDCPVFSSKYTNFTGIFRYRCQKRNLF